MQHTPVGYIDAEEVAKVLFLFDHLHGLEKTAGKFIGEWQLEGRVSAGSMIELFMRRKGAALGAALKGRLEDIDKVLGETEASDLDWLQRFARHEAGKAWIEANVDRRMIEADQAVNDENQLGGSVCFHSSLEAHVFRIAYPHGTDAEPRAWLSRDRADGNGKQWDERIRPFSNLVLLDTINYTRDLVLVNPNAWRDLTQSALDRYELDAQQILMPTDKPQTPEAVFSWLREQVKGEKFRDANGSFIFSWSWDDGSGHAIQVDFGKGRLGFWDANQGRFNWAASGKEFKSGFLSYLRAFSGVKDFQIDIPKLKALEI